MFLIGLTSSRPISISQRRSRLAEPLSPRLYDLAVRLGETWPFLLAVPFVGLLAQAVLEHHVVPDWLLFTSVITLGGGGIQVWVARRGVPWRRPIGLSFIPGEPPYREVRRGVSKIPNSSLAARGSSRFLEPWTLTTYRVRVVNRTSETLTNCALHLDTFDPPISMPNDMPLHQMHDNPQHESQFQRTFTLPPGGYKDIDVVCKDSMGTPSSAAVSHVVFNISRTVSSGRHEVILRGFCDKAPSRYWRFVVVADYSDFDFRPSSSQTLRADTGASSAERAR
jgi:hypothetical protein